MKKLERQSVVCEGQFNGGEIEPGTFHVHNSQKKSDSEKRNASNDSNSMPDSDGENAEQDVRPVPDNICY